jgi:hypothetical protein
MSDSKFIVWLVVICLLVLGGGMFLLTRNPSKAAVADFSSGGTAVAQRMNEDWGKIAYAGGNKEATFEIKNSADSPLKLRNVRTSCHCTQAKLNINGKESPLFGMSGNSPWVGEVPPGGTASLKVVFDPAYHGPNGVGPIERFTKIETSDPQNTFLNFSVKGVVEK